MMTADMQKKSCIRIFRFIEAWRKKRVIDIKAVEKMKFIIRKRILLALIPLSIIASVSIYLLLSLPAEPDERELDLYFRAMSAYETGDLDLTVKLSEALNDGNPSFYQAGLLHAKALFFSGRYIEAREQLDELLKDRGNYFEAEIWLVRCLLQLEEIGQANLYAEEMLSRAPEDPRVLGILARIAVLEKRYQPAIEYYNRAILFEEELAINRIELAKIYSSLLNIEEAGVQLEKALQLLSDESPLRPAIISLLKKLE